MSYIPFEVFIKVIPARDHDKRFTYVRELQKLGIAAYEEIIAAIDMVSSPPVELNIATPGGGQQDGVGVISNHANGLMVKPQFGDYPAQITISGFQVVDNLVTQYDDTTIISGNTVYTGQQVSKCLALPTEELSTLASNLKGIIEDILSDVEDDTDAGIKVYKLILCGVVFGEGGFHLN